MLLSVQLDSRMNPPGAGRMGFLATRSGNMLVSSYAFVEMAGGAHRGLVRPF